MRRWSAVSLVVLVAMSLASCDDGRGGDNQAYLLLLRGDGSQREFLMGEYDTLLNCSKAVTREMEMIFGDQGGEFGVNADFSYGGAPNRNWETTTVVGGGCYSRSASGQVGPS